MFERVSSEEVTLNVSFPELHRIEIAFEDSLLDQVEIVGGDELVKEIALAGKLACALDEEPVALSKFSLPNGDTQFLEYRSRTGQGVMTIFVRGVEGEPALKVDE